jgi:hypothetical protein
MGMRHLVDHFDGHTSGLIEATADATAIHLSRSLRRLLFTADASATSSAGQTVAATAAVTASSACIVALREAAAAGIDRISEEVREYLWEAIHAVPFKQVHQGYRDAFGWVALVQATLASLTGTPSSSHNQRIDVGILLGSDYYHESLMKLLVRRPSAEKRFAADGTVEPFPKRTRAPSQQHQTYPFLSNKTLVPGVIKRLHTPDLRSFYEQHLLLSEPVLLTGCIGDWPAMTKWSSTDYLSQEVGDRTVPVEIGATYLAADYAQQLMTVDQFIASFLRPTDEGGTARNGYLAQHQLFEQIPALKKDVIVPDYCCLLMDADEEIDQIIMNAWLGPTTTVSPLHYDPYHNLLAQVVGYKYVRLYAPSQSAQLYAKTGKMSNNSEVDICQLDVERFPLAVECPYQETILCPGDMLFIPR